MLSANERSAIFSIKQTHKDEGGMNCGWTLGKAKLHGIADKPPRQGEKRQKKIQRAPIRV